MKLKFFLFFLFLSIYCLNSSDFIEKKYTNNVFGGGKERLIFKNQAQKRNIDILSMNVTIDLYENYSKVNIVYSIINRKDTTECNFLYPKIDSYIEKSIADSSADQDSVSTKIESHIINGDYKNFSIKVNEQTANYSMEKSDFMTLNLPFKIGDSKIIFYDTNKIHEEVIESFVHKYCFYSTPLTFQPKEIKKIEISYITPNYFNEINVKNYSPTLNYEDPSLQYTSYSEGSDKFYKSDRVFNFLFYTVYANNEERIRSIIVKLNSHIISNDYLKIMPRNYTKWGKTFTWRYRNLLAKPLHIITARISSSYSPKTYPNFAFDVTPKKIKYGNDDYYEINKEKDAFIFKYNAKDTNLKTEFANIEEIRIMPGIYTNKETVENANKIIELELTFSKNENFSDPIKYNKKINEREYFKLINSRNYITIFKTNSSVECKFIKIKILGSTDDQEKIIRINDFQIIKE